MASMDLDTALLRAFVATAEELHFGRASGQLFLSQQALSKRIARLEVLLGVQLFERTNRRVALTPAGHRLVAPARDALSQVDAALAAVGAWEGPLTVDVLNEHLPPMRMLHQAIDRDPTHVRYRGLDVYGMAPPSSGGITVGEALNILEGSDLSTMEPTQALHHYLEASRLSFADRNRYIGDSDFVDVPQDALLSDEFAARRACLIDPAQAMRSPIPPGDPTGAGDCGTATPASAPVNEGDHTNHFVVSDLWGNVVSYTNTIEQLGGSGITVSDRGFLLNNELTDFNFAPTQGEAPDPNLPAPAKRPRSSMSPTIVLQDGKPFLAVGSPGGATIITTVLQILVNRLDLGMTLPEALAAPRATQRNAAKTEAEPAFLALDTTPGLEALGHQFTERSSIGVAAGLEFLKHGKVLAVGEPTRRGGTSAAVVLPVP